MDWELILSTILNYTVSIAWKLVVSAAIFFAGVFLIKLLLKLFPNGSKFSHMDETVRIFLNNIIKISLYCLLAVIIVSIMGIPMASVITVLATAGAAIALAVQGSFANLMGGIMILIFKPVRVGEVVKIQGETGTVTEVGFFYTEIKTFDNVHVSIPNGTLTNSVVTNYSREDIRRAEITLDVAYGSDLELVKKIILYVLQKNGKVLQDPEPFVRVTNMKESSIEFTVRAWTKAENFALLKSDLYEQCEEAFRAAGVEIPFNHMEVIVSKKG